MRICVGKRKRPSRAGKECRPGCTAIEFLPSGKSERCDRCDIHGRGVRASRSAAPKDLITELSKQITLRAWTAYAALPGLSLSEVPLKRREPVRVLHVTVVHPPFDTRVFHMEAKSLAAAGFDVSLATTVDRAQTVDGVKLLPLGEFGGTRFRRIPRQARALRAMLGDYDVIHIHDPELLVAAAFARAAGKRVVFDVHEFYHEKFGGGDVTAGWLPKPLLPAVRAAYAAVESLLLPRLAGAVVVSDAMIPHYRRFFPEERVALVRNFPSIDEDARARAIAAPAPLPEPYVIHAGGASADRAFATVVRTGEILREMGVAAPLVNIGPVDLQAYDPRERESLLARAQRADVRLLGTVPYPEAQRWIAHARVGYLPLSYSENNARGQPRKLIEYFLFGLPVVAAGFGNIGALVQSRGAGITVQHDDAADHARALAAMLNDDALREGYAAASRSASAETFGNELPKLVALYESITSGQA